MIGSTGFDNAGIGIVLYLPYLKWKANYLELNQSTEIDTRWTRANGRFVCKKAHIIFIGFLYTTEENRNHYL